MVGLRGGREGRLGREICSRESFGIEASCETSEG